MRTGHFADFAQKKFTGRMIRVDFDQLAVDANTVDWRVGNVLPALSKLKNIYLVIFHILRLPHSATLLRIGIQGGGFPFYSRLQYGRYSIYLIRVNRTLLCLALTVLACACI